MGWVPLVDCERTLEQLDSASPGAAAAWGFRTGDSGPHSSRSLMLDDMEWAMSEFAEANVTAEDFHSAIVDENCLMKRTYGARKSAYKALRRIYGLDTSLPLFAVMRKLYRQPDASVETKASLCLMLAAARDPLLRASFYPVQGTGIGEAVSRQEIGDFVAFQYRDDRAADRIAVNVLRTWTVAGHLDAADRKTRTAAPVSRESVAYGLYLGYASGYRGQRLFESPWMATLGLDRGFGDVPRWIELAEDAHRVSMLTMRRTADIIDVRFPDDWPHDLPEDIPHEESAEASAPGAF